MDCFHLKVYALLIPRSRLTFIPAVRPLFLFHFIFNTTYFYLWGINFLGHLFFLSEHSIPLFYSYFCVVRSGRLTLEFAFTVQLSLHHLPFVFPLRAFLLVRRAYGRIWTLASYLLIRPPEPTILWKAAPCNICAHITPPALFKPHTAMNLNYRTRPGISLYR